MSVGEQMPCESAPASQQPSSAADLAAGPLKNAKFALDKLEQPLEYFPSLLEAALDAWATCLPEGSSIEAETLSRSLPAIARHVPGGTSSAQTANRLSELFVPDSEGSPALFETMAKVRRNRVHFLDFWRAFSKAARLVALDAGLEAQCSDALSEELETLRDSLLRTLDARCGPKGTDAGAQSLGTMMAPAGRLTIVELSSAVDSARAMSSSPAFWTAAEETLTSLSASDKKTVTLEEVTGIILIWLREAISWQNKDETKSDEQLLGPKARGLPVLLHIYDVSQEENVHKLNKYLAHKRNPLKFGGVFHAGVEVNGLEWSFGQTCTDTMPGVSCCEPTEHPAHRFRQTVTLGNTPLSAEEISDLIFQLIEAWPGDSYELLRRNCCHFADDFCRQLDVGGIPRWVHRLARLGSQVDTVMRAVLKRGLLPDEPDDSDSD